MNRCLRFLLFGLILAATTFAQSNKTSLDKKVMLSGRVYDANGSVVMGSDVLARSRDGNDYQARTNDEGIYNIELPVGIYKVEANANGFCPKRVELVFAQKLVQPKNRNLSVLNSVQEQKSVDFVLEMASPATPGTIGPGLCKQKTMIKKELPKRIFRSIAD
jgi:hypothetical protein